MDFDLSEEQRLLKESLDRLIGDRYAFEQRKGYGQSPDGWSRELWAQYAELGLLGLPFAERYGGSGGGPVETMIAMEAFGRALALEPFLATVVLGGGFLRHGGNAEQCAALIPKIADGSLTLAFAHTERQSRYNLADISTRGGSRRRRLGARRRQGCRAARRQRRPADRDRTGRRRAARARRGRPLSRRRPGCGRLAARLSDPGRSARRRDQPRRRARRPGRGAGRAGRGFAIGRARRRRRDRSALRRGGRRHGGDARADRRLLEDAPAVRPRDRQLSGAAAPRRRHAGGVGAGAQHGDVRDDDDRRGKR